MVDEIIELIYNSSLQKRPKKLQNNVFVLYFPKRIKLRPVEFINVDMKLPVRIPEEIIAACVLQHFVQMDFLWKAFNIFQQTTTLAMLVSLLTYRGKYILNWLIEVQILFFQYAKDKGFVSLQP